MSHKQGTVGFSFPSMKRVASCTHIHVKAQINCTHIDERHIIGRELIRRRIFVWRPWRRCLVSLEKMNNINEKEMLRERKIKYWIKSRRCVGVCELCERMQQLNNSLDGYINLWEIFSRYFLHIIAYLWKFECSEWLWSPTTRRSLCACFLVWLENEKQRAKWMIENIIRAVCCGKVKSGGNFTEVEFSATWLSLSWLFRNVTAHYQSRETFNVASDLFLTFHHKL